MKVLQFEQSRPAMTTAAVSASPVREPEESDADSARTHAAIDEGHPHEEPGYGHGV